MAFRGPVVRDQSRPVTADPGRRGPRRVGSRAKSPRPCRPDGAGAGPVLVRDDQRPPGVDLDAQILAGDLPQGLVGGQADGGVVVLHRLDEIARGPWVARLENSEGLDRGDLAVGVGVEGHRPHQNGGVLGPADLAERPAGLDPDQRVGIADEHDDRLTGGGVAEGPEGPADHGAAGERFLARFEPLDQGLDRTGLLLVVVVTTGRGEALIRLVPLVRVAALLNLVEEARRGRRAHQGAADQAGRGDHQGEPGPSAGDIHVVLAPASPGGGWRTEVGRPSRSTAVAAANPRARRRNGQAQVASRPRGRVRWRIRGLMTGPFHFVPGMDWKPSPNPGKNSVECGRYVSAI